MNLFLHLLLGPLLLLITLWIQKNPPKKINNLYGYRTGKSMKNQNTWEVANQYSNELMMKSAIATILFQVFAIISFNPEVAFISSTIVLLVAVVIVIPITEKYLNKLFDKEGNWREPYV